jgi:hypothetical protein
MRLILATFIGVLATCGFTSIVVAGEDVERVTSAPEIANPLVRDAIEQGAALFAKFVVGESAENDRRASDVSTTASAECAGASCRTCCDRVASSAAESKSIPLAMHGARTDDGADVPLSIAAREILKLRRAVGMNPMAGTIFDGLGRDAQTSANDVASATHAEEQTIAAAIRQLENDEAAAPRPPAESSTLSEPHYPPLGRLLRPAEHHLEEAATLLEQAGQYDRADAARDLAARIRQDVRKLEAQRPPLDIPSVLLSGPDAH